MLLADAVDAVDAGQIEAGPPWLLAGARQLWKDESFRTQVRGLIAEAFWAKVWPAIKDERIKVQLWIFRPSARIEALRWVFVKVFGEPRA